MREGKIPGDREKALGLSTERRGCQVMAGECATWKGEGKAPGEACGARRRIIRGKKSDQCMCPRMDRMDAPLIPLHSVERQAALAGTHGGSLQSQIEEGLGDTGIIQEGENVSVL